MIHVEYDDFGSYEETVELEPVGFRKKSPERRPQGDLGIVL